MPYTLIEAWDELDKKYPVINIYDAYILGSWEDALDNLEKRAEVENLLKEVEIKFGLVTLYDRADTVKNQLEKLNLPVLGYKYDIEDKVEICIKNRAKELKKELLLLQEKIDNKLSNIYLEEDIFA